MEQLLTDPINSILMLIIGSTIFFLYFRKMNKFLNSGDEKILDFVWILYIIVASVFISTGISGLIIH